MKKLVLIVSMLLVLGIGTSAQATLIAEAGGINANPYGNYYVTPGNTLILYGSYSYDPPGSGDVVYSWDLNNDGNYGDSNSQNTLFSVGLQYVVYLVNLKVTDTSGAYGIDSAYINVVEFLPPPPPPPVSTPEPSTMLLLGLGLIGLVGVRRKFQK